METIRDANWLLSVGTFLPIVGVLVLLVVPKGEEQLIKLVALLTSIATVAVGVYTLMKFDFGNSGQMQFVAQTDWISIIKSTYLIGIDGNPSGSSRWVSAPAPVGCSTTTPSSKASIRSCLSTCTPPGALPARRP